MSNNGEADKRATAPLEIVYCDLAGPITPATREGFKYTLSCIDDYTGVSMVYFLKEKSDVVKGTERFLADVSPYGKVKCVRSDNGGGFISAEFENLLVRNQIKHEIAAQYSPHQNDTVEKSWRTVFEMARCRISESKLPKELWTYAVMCSVYIRNRCFNPRLGKTPFEAFTGEKPDLSGMHIFGSTCYADAQNPKKLDDRSEEGIFVGYDKGSPAYLVYYPESKVVRKVRFVKSTNRVGELHQMTDPLYADVVRKAPEPVINGVPNEHEPIVAENRVDERDENVRDEIGRNENVREQIVRGEEPDDHVRRYPNRERNKPKHLNDYVASVDGENCGKFTVDYCFIMSDVQVDTLTNRKGIKFDVRTVKC